MADPRYLALVTAHLERFEARNRATIDRVADIALEVIRNDGLVHVAGSGHSTIFVMEAFYRAGGLACVNPIWHPALLPLSGGGLSTRLERVEGVGEELIRSAGVRAGDLLVVYSQSGINPVPIDIAQSGRAAGASVVAITSLAHSRAVATRQRQGLRLADVADVVIDTAVPVGDAIYRAAGSALAVAPLSSIVGIYAWNAILVRLADRAAAAGVELPVWRSANIPGGDDTGEVLRRRYAGRIRSL